MHSDCHPAPETEVFPLPPRHVAIIMDGNRRWGKRQSVNNPFEGHWAGARVLLDVVEAAADQGVKVLTVFGFSTENWGRSTHEVETLFDIMESYLRENRQKMLDRGVRLHVIGMRASLPDSLQEEIKRTEEATAGGEMIDLVVALNYGGRSEMVRVIQALGKRVAQGELSPEAISEERVAEALDTAPFGDPDLLIRTSGEMRVSNFLLWQLAYTEIVVTDVLWPDFTPEELGRALQTYQGRQRRRGR